MQREMTIRICATCNKPLNFQPDGTQEGILCHDEYYHEGDCVDVSLPSGEHWEEHYKQMGGDDSSECYYTEWEVELVEQETI